MLLFLCMFVNFVRSKRHVVLVLFAVLVFTMAVIPSTFTNLANDKGEEDIATGKTLDADTGKTTEVPPDLRHDVVGQERESPRIPTSSGAFFSIFADFWLEAHLYLIAGLAMLLVRGWFDDYPAETPPAAKADGRRLDAAIANPA